MYIVSSCENVLGCWLPYLEMCKLCIQDLELSYTQPSCY